MRLKNVSCGILSAMMLLSCNSAFATGSNPNDVIVKLDGRTLDFDVNPIIEEGSDEWAVVKELIILYLTNYEKDGRFEEPDF